MFFYPHQPVFGVFLFLDKKEVLDTSEGKVRASEGAQRLGTGKKEKVQKVIKDA